MPPAGWALAAVALVAIAATVIYWLLASTEGAYLGPRVVTLLYDRYATRYDQVKEYDERYEQHFVGEPVARFLAERAGELAQPVWILDVAAGTGRFARTVRQSAGDGPLFVCLDRSRAMLEQARRNLEPAVGQVVYVQHDARPLPFVDNAFPVVACLEALEFMADPPAVTAELVRVARPGGLLVLTNRIGWQSRLFPGRRFSREQLAGLLRRQGCSFVSVTPWQVDYDRVLAVKAGAAAGPAARDWHSLLRCPVCQQSVWTAQGSGLGCSSCGAAAEALQDIWRFVGSAG